MELIAYSPQELETALVKMKEWCDDKIAYLAGQVRYEKGNLTLARERKWKTTAFQLRIKHLERRMTFFQKAKAAVELGYYIVPNFPMDIFAIRSKKTYPTTQPTPGSVSIPAQALPQGEGEYHSPNPTISEWKEDYKDYQGKSCSRMMRKADRWLEPEFPFDLAKPMLMTKVGQAMSLKLFDEVGVARDFIRRGDPMILGRLLNVGTRPAITFFLAWHFDPERL